MKQLWQHIGRFGLTLILAAFGGALAHAAGLPLAWMLGPMMATFAAALWHVPVGVPERMRLPVLVVLGLFIGDQVSPDTLSHVTDWPYSLAGAILLMPVQMALGLWWFRRWAQVDGVSALLAGGPGALSAMVAATDELGGDTARVLLAHILRISLVVTLVPFLAYGVFHLADRPPLAVPLKTATLQGCALLLGTSFALWWVLARLGLPLASLMSGLLTSLIVHGMGLTQGGLPPWALGAALIISGASLGSRFVKVDWVAMRRMSLAAITYTLVLMVLGSAVALLIAELTGLPPVPMMLAFAPGGISEMCLIALAIHADPGFVALHHIARLLTMILSMPLIIKWAAASR